jgi:hypothetical protein
MSTAIDISAESFIMGIVMAGRLLDRFAWADIYVLTRCQGKIFNSNFDGGRPDVVGPRSQSFLLLLPTASCYTVHIFCLHSLSQIPNQYQILYQRSTTPSTHPGFATETYASDYDRALDFVRK